MHTQLNPYRARFKSVVMRHVEEAIGAQEWSRLRSLASDRARSSVPDTPPDLNATPRALLDEALSIDGLSLDEILVAPFKARAIEIGTIEESPVYYIEGEGVYLWTLNPDARITMSFWATHPAYPPSW